MNTIRKARRIPVAAGCLWLLMGSVFAADSGAEKIDTQPFDLGAGVHLDVVPIPAGEFEMGAGESEKNICEKCELPCHTVKIATPFLMGRHEVTNEQFRCFRPAHHSGTATGDLDGDKQPALFISWYDAVGFCRWLSEKSGKNVRLPTEAEWEYACRAGSAASFYSGAMVREKIGYKRELYSSEVAALAWLGANSRGVSHEAGQRKPNAWGLYDMHGNAWEWCQDWFGRDYYKNSPKEDPQGPQTGTAKVMRGGCYYFWCLHYARSAYRFSYKPEAREPVTGFRVIVSTMPAPLVEIPPEKPVLMAPPFTVSSDAERRISEQFGLPVTTIAIPELPPTIDGQLEDACWAARPTFLLRNLNGRAALPTQPTTVMALADKENLYVAFDCREDEMKNIVVKERSEDIWQGDVVELYFDPQHRANTPYYHIMVNADGKAICNMPGGTAWTPLVKACASRHSQGWRVELAVPMKDLGVQANAIPSVWGINFTRFRPGIADVAPQESMGTARVVNEPDRLRLVEDSAWSPVNTPSGHTPSHFGHCLVLVGNKDTPPPKKLFEILIKEDFSNGIPSRFTGKALELVDGGYMGAGKAIQIKTGDAVACSGPFSQLYNTHLLVTLRTHPGSQIYWDARGELAGDNKICFRQVTTLTRDSGPIRRLPSFSTSGDGGCMSAYDMGVTDTYYAGFDKHLLWSDEPTIGRIMCAGPEHWAVVYARPDFMITQHPDFKALDPNKETLKAFFFHPGENDAEMLIGNLVYFRGVDIEAPEQVQGVTCKVEGGQALLRWSPARDNTLTVWYRVQDEDKNVIADVAELSVALPLASVKGKKLTVVAVDYFENFSKPSALASVK